MTLFRVKSDPGLFRVTDSTILHDLFKRMTQCCKSLALMYIRHRKRAKEPYHCKSFSPSFSRLARMKVYMCLLLLMVVGCTLIFAETDDVLECNEAGPFGMEDGRIPDASITASSYSTSYPPREGRLNFDDGSWRSGWCNADRRELQPWIQVDLGCDGIITSVITQGMRGYSSTVISYRVAYSDDGREWTVLTNNGSVVYLRGSYNNDTAVTNTLPRAIRARFLRIYPRGYYVGICMRFEVVGCCP
ncbi:lactadherin-like [Patiria miniata]|uniref:F5/8 type C domain-containing protein n=1 Tax=Patiria miniata TaxID=46514 RepID=A0A914A5R8_PATMI|nr:lactadherin-like [Patiria miniata]